MAQYQGRWIYRKDKWRRLAQGAQTQDLTRIAREHSNVRPPDLWDSNGQRGQIPFYIARHAPARPQGRNEASEAWHQIHAIVPIEVTPARQPAIRQEHPDIVFRPLSLRLVKYGIDGTTYTLGTTLLDGDVYPREAFPDLYHARWGIEDLYKVSPREEL